MKAHTVVRRRGSHIFKTVGSQMAVRLSAPRAGRPLPPGRFLVLISVRDWVDHRGILRLELKNPVTSSGIAGSISYFWCRDSSVGIATGYWMDGRGSIPGRGNIFFFSIVSGPARGLSQPPIQWVSGALSPEVRRPGREADHSSPPSAEVKNGGAVPPFPHTSSWPVA
jgi:hypothetical protein